jgi:hypothetical protein
VLHANGTNKGTNEAGLKKILRIAKSADWIQNTSLGNTATPAQWAKFLETGAL